MLTLIRNLHVLEFLLLPLWKSISVLQIIGCVMLQYCRHVHHQPGHKHIEGHILGACNLNIYLFLVEWEICYHLIYLVPSQSLHIAR